MIPIDPAPEAFLLPAGTESVRYAEDHPDYLPLPSLRTPDGRVVTQWRLEPREVELLRSGEPVTLVLRTFNQPLQPVILTVGGLDLT